MIIQPKISQPITEANSHEVVLVVDDSKAHRHLICKRLKRWGYSTYEAETGEEALAICHEKEIGLVLSDWTMPGMSGVEFCRSYRNLSTERSGYFILLTAKNDADVLAEGLESGADDFLSKPVGAVELRARLRAGHRILEAQRALRQKNGELSQTLDRLTEAYSAIERDLLQAKKFQQSLVPDRQKVLGDYRVSLLFQPCGHVGGDMVGYFPVSQKEFGFYSVDVSGHGVSSALMAARVASLFSASAPERNIGLRPLVDGYEFLPPHETCSRLNNLVQRESETDLYMTMTLACISTETGCVTLCQAGHPSAAVIRADGDIVFERNFSMPVGLLDDAEFASAEIKLGCGDKLLIYSDGVVECVNPEGRLFGEAGLKDALYESQDLSGLELLGKLEAMLSSFAEDGDFQDDVSAILLERI